MAARPSGSGTISFGLVTIPVKVYTANKSGESISFNLLHDKCHSRLKQQYVCPVDGEIVERSQMVKGYQYAKDQYVLFSEEELKALERKSTQQIEIVEFVPGDTVDPIYFDKVYYLGPDKHGERPYALLSAALEETERWALARYSTRGKQYVVAIRPYQDGLLMQQLRYANEVRKFSELGIENDVEIKQQELDLAITLADQVSTDEFHPENYTDEETARIRDVIGQKIQGEEVSLAPDEPKGEIIDLMEALKKSLDASGAREAPKSKSGAKGGAKRMPAKRAASKKKKPAARKTRKKKSS